MAVVHQHSGTRTGMKDTTSSSTADLGGIISDGGERTRSSSPSSLDMNSLSPPCSSKNLAIVTAAAAAISAGLHPGTAEGMSPLLSNQIYHNAPMAESLLAASQTAALMAATSVGGNPHRLPVGLQTLPSGPTLFHHQRTGNIFNWSSASVSPLPVTTTDSSNNNNRMTAKKNNNHHVAVNRKNQANAKKRAGRKTDSVEPTIIEVASMTQITTTTPSPPTSGLYRRFHVTQCTFPITIHLREKLSFMKHYRKHSFTYSTEDEKTTLKESETNMSEDVGLKLMSEFVTTWASLQQQPY